MLFLLTKKGKIESQKIREERLNHEFNEMIDHAASSKAYLDYCLELYGYRKCLFNMMDKSQLDYLFNSIPINQNDTILDLGCGNGSILNGLMQKYQCQGIGIDQLNSELIKKDNNLISYINGSIDKLEEYSLNPSITIAVDSLYFSDDLDKLLTVLTGIKDNRLYLYYSQYIFDEKTEDRSMLNCNNTRLAKSLEKVGINYMSVDYSENERNLYARAMDVLPKYKKAFENEGNADLYLKKYNENKFGNELYEKGCASRYLYIAKNK
jgi:SAM-dependent methyltransferase